MVTEKMHAMPDTVRMFWDIPTADLLDGFCRWLTDHGHALSTVRGFIDCANTFLLKRSGDSRSFHTAVKDSLSLLDDCDHYAKWRRELTRRALRRFEEYIRESGYGDVAEPQSPRQVLVTEYLQWMREYHNSTEGTLELRRFYLDRFLLAMGIKPPRHMLSELSLQKVESFFLRYCRDHTRSQRNHMQVALRTFLRFCHFKGYIAKRLDYAVPVFRTYKLATVPHGIADEDAERLLSHIDRTTATGKRDYAIIMLLYTYGVRGGQVRALRLDDIEWARSRIRFPVLKRGKSVVVPLTSDVGLSLLDYLAEARPDTVYPQVFLTAQAPFRPMLVCSSLGRAIRRQMTAAGIVSPSFGAHIFRHAFACRMLRNGHSLKCVADMLGHREISSTAIYAKVDFSALESVALDWPEETK
jgi:integrase/recombinase XerD